jgi:hypothetical protein
MSAASPVARFAIANLLVAGAGFIAMWVCLIAALSTYLLAIVIRYFEEGRTSPEWAMGRFLTMLFPFFGILVVGGLPSSPLVKSLYVSAFAQFTVFCLLVHYRA